VNEPRRTGGKPATINDIARLAEVSKKTVSRVINNSPFVKEETRNRVEAVIAEHGYSPDPQARGLAFRRSFLVGMIYDNPSPNYVVNMQQGVLDGVRGSGLELVVHPCNRGSDTFLADVQGFIVRQKLFGVVLPPSVSEDDRVVAILEEADCPYVRIASVSLDEPARMVVTHDSRGAARAARHLAELGHTRIAFISGPDTFRSSHERGRGFAEGLAEHGLGLHADTLNAVHDHKGAVRHTEGGGHLGRKVHVTRGVDEVDEVGNRGLLVDDITLVVKRDTS
jgi:LacI family transcriptional regulator